MNGDGCRIPLGPGAHKILIVTDTWAPQVNGVVRTLQSVKRELRLLGHAVEFATPENRTTLPLPTYPEIRLAVYPRPALIAQIDTFRPDAIHIATEGPIGFAVRMICIERGLAFTTSFHTRFPEYVHARFPFIPESAVYAALKNFHAPASAVMVSTQTMMQELASQGFANVRRWSRGVDVETFFPGARDGFERLGLALERPIHLYVGRVAVEKNIEGFLSADLPGTKVVVGDGPSRPALEQQFPQAHFLGMRSGEELSRLYSSSDVFVFPSRTDTFGLVMLEALASGIPVAAYPVPGPLDVIGGTAMDTLDDDLAASCQKALTIPREEARRFALERSWRTSAGQFLSNLARAHGVTAVPRQDSHS